MYVCMVGHDAVLFSGDLHGLGPLAQPHGRLQVRPLDTPVHTYIHTCNFF